MVFGCCGKKNNAVITTTTHQNTPENPPQPAGNNQKIQTPGLPPIHTTSERQQLSSLDELTGQPTTRLMNDPSFSLGLLSIFQKVESYMSGKNDPAKRGQSPLKTMNNPLNLTDPSGYSWISKKWKQIRIKGSSLDLTQQIELKTGLFGASIKYVKSRLDPFSRIVML